MLSEKQTILLIKILALILAAVFSFFVAASWLPGSGFVRDSLESVEDSSATVMEFSAATLSVSLAISALPDDFATPLADSLADMNVYFVAILAVLFLEKILIRYGIRAAFAFLIPAACVLGVLFVTTRRELFKGLAVRLCVLGLAVAFVVPCSTHITDLVASDLTAYVDETIEEAESGAGKLNEAMEEGGDGRTIFEKLSDLFQTAVDGISGLMVHFQDTIRQCMNSIAILVLTNCLMPLLTLLVLKWILGELFQIALPLPPLGRRRGGPGPEPGTWSGSGGRPGGDPEREDGAELISAGGRTP